MKRIAATILIACLTGGASIQGALAQGKPAAAKDAKETTATGQHRGFTNDKLYFLPDGGKEITLKVEIPGDKDWKWHKAFETLSRVTVTYHADADGKLVATAIKKAP
jgi:hypothetical protein